MWFECDLARVEFGGEHYLQVVVVDITKRKHAEAQLRHNATLLELLNDAVVSTDASFVVKSWNNGAERTYGWTAEEAIGKPSLEAVSAVYESPEERQQIADTLIREGLFEGQLVHRHRDGTPIDVWISVSVIRDDSGEFAGTVMVGRDLTELIREREARAASEAGVHALLEASPDAIITVDTQARIQGCSAGAVELFGYASEADLVGRNGQSLLAGPDLESGIAALEAALLGEEPGITQFTMVRADGAHFDAEINAARMRSAEGQLQGFIVTLRDVTERMRTEQERARIDKLESLGVLAGGVAHDFNNILTGLITNLSIAVDEDRTGEDNRASVAQALDAARRATGLTSQLLTFSKGGAPIKETGTVGDMVTQTARFALSGSSCRAALTLADDLWPANMDRGQISQVVENLVINADQSMPGGGVVRIDAHNHEETAEGTATVPDMDPGRYVHIAIADEGAGIDPRYLDKIFDPFFTTKQKGSGLGLTSSFSIVRKHDGHVTVESQLGQGTTVSIYLPASSEPVATAGRAHKPLHGTGRILVMDDNLKVLASSKRLLARLGYRVVTTPDGAACIAEYAKAQADGDPFDLVIMDLTIPGGMGGRDTVAKLLEIDPKVRALVSSGYSNDPVLADPAAYGFRGAVPKPYSTEVMSQAIVHILGDEE